MSAVAPERTDHDFDRVRKYIYLPILVVYTTFHLTTIFFYYHRVLRQSKQPRYIAIINHLAALALCITICASNAFRFRFACSINLWAYYLFTLVWWITFLARTARLSYLSEVSRAKLYVTRVPFDHEELDPAHLDTVPRGTGPAGSVWPLSCLGRRLSWSRLHSLFSEASLLRITAATTLVVLVYCTAAQLMASELHSVSPGRSCGLALVFLPLYVAVAFLLVVICPLILFLLTPLRDAYGLKREVMITTVVALVAFPLFFLVDAVLVDYVQYAGGSVYLFAGFCVIHVSTVVVPLVRTWRHPLPRYIGSHQYNQTIPLHPIGNDPCSSVETLGSNSPSSLSPALPKSASPIPSAPSLHARSASAGHGFHWEDFCRTVGNTAEFSRLKHWASLSFSSELVAFLEDYQRLKKRVCPALAATAAAEATAANLARTNLQWDPTVIDETKSGRFVRDQYRSVDLTNPETALTTSAPMYQTVVTAASLDPWGHDAQLMEHPSPAYMSILGTMRPIRSTSDGDRTHSPEPLSANPQIQQHFPLGCEVMVRNFYRRYILPNSDMALNLSHQMQTTIAAEMAKDTLHLSLFDSAHHEVLILLYQNVFPKYWHREWRAGYST
ncbi:hypothetical protein IWQ60_001449 [Tieghemiomyces parasiticus]|uniref:RGS domain-containing protein n=1 Tax=Tieghemiomyces parasiticus TaxID=78921 RepID=A0A9W8AL64_9FUNG|nr:hypothetical protein IWQ60_001449 [Tieghemiomyces parasiticus]